jgi:hypothetical protein
MRCNNRVLSIRRNEMISRRLVLLIVLVLSLAACGPAVPGEMAKIDKILKTDLPMSPEDRARAENLRAEGERLYREGKGDDVLRLLQEAREIFQRAADANLFNKSDG